MKKNLIITKSNKKLEDYEEKLELNTIDTCDVLFITDEYHENNTHITFKNSFSTF